ncbi:hypothetical protein OH77DRAFT_582320 [Trametes cingulata]|nr:hypothetical protein OH77DRAFT_582320 [Trametes cingulata]
MSLSPNATTASPDPFALLPKVPSLKNTYGAILIGTFVSLMLYGVTLHQVYRYLRTYSSDSYLTKCYVGLLLLLDTLHSILCMHMCYWYLVSNYFSPLRLYTGIWSINLLSVLVGCTIVACQCFYVRRVYLINRKYKYIVALSCGMFLVVLACATGATVEASILPNYSEFEKVTWLISAGFGGAVVIDVMLTTVLIVTLHRRRTGFRRTDSIIDVLILYAMCTGLLTDILSALTFIFALVVPNEMIYVGLDTVAAKVYVNSVLAALNLRESFAHGSGNSGAMAAAVALFRRPYASSEPGGHWDTSGPIYVDSNLKAISEPLPDTPPKALSLNGAIEQQVLNVGLQGRV